MSEYLCPMLYVEERARSSSTVLVSDRDPIVDTLCYSNLYLPDGFSRIARPSLKFLLEYLFSYSNSFYYLDVSPEVSAKRNNKPLQLHDTIKYLNRLKELFEEEIFSAERRGIPVVRIKTDDKPLEEVASEVGFYVKRLL